ncbi:SpnB-like Rossmann fold domain-containing protein, partial [Streptosporangium sp. V21-05]|uniref:SpnB-like Rossmann fold domain-containing protein n=1 Tax=Streptosporangium sp. V21-05 TaxID=3446115 RepID=UPI003F533383
MVRAAQAEQPGRLVLLDLDTEALDESVVAQALATGEPQVAVRDGHLLIPGLNRMAEPVGVEPGLPDDAELSGGV